MVGSVKADESHKGPDVRLCQTVTKQERTVQLIFQRVEHLEYTADRLVICFLGGGEAGAINAVVQAGPEDAVEPQVFVDRDASLAEINPLVLTGGGDVIALDGKINFDDNALFRQDAVAALRDMTEENESEIEAKSYGRLPVSLQSGFCTRRKTKLKTI